MNVAIVDFGGGNTRSVAHALEAAGAESTMAASPEQILAADRLVLPGVGASRPVMDGLRRDGLVEALTEVVRGRGRPMLGICVGMQVLAEKLHEFGPHAGLGWIAGEVMNLRSLAGSQIRVPHMGWNDVEVDDRAAALFRGVRGRRQFYFCHSFALRPVDSGIVAATTSYDVTLIAAILSETVLATQFHPEKSQINGQRLIEGFLDWRP